MSIYFFLCPVTYLDYTHMAENTEAGRDVHGLTDVDNNT